jgi:hypothetical protein
VTRLYTANDEAKGDESDDADFMWLVQQTVDSQRYTDQSNRAQVIECINLSIGLDTGVQACSMSMRVSGDTRRGIYAASRSSQFIRTASVTLVSFQSLRDERKFENG